MYQGYHVKSRVKLTYENDMSMVKLVENMQVHILTNVGGRITKKVAEAVQHELELARENPPWTPRTGKAQEGLTIDTVKTDKQEWEISVYFDPKIVKAYRPRARSSNKDGFYRYGYSLEFLHGRKYAIIRNLTQRVFSRAMRTIQDMFDNPRRRDANRS